MDKRTARRKAHSWVASVIEGALLNGGYDHLGAGDDAADFERVQRAIRDLQAEHERKAQR